MDSKKKYTHLFFDLDNTLWDFKKNSYLAMESAFTHFKLDNEGTNFDTFFKIYSIHNSSLWGQYRNKTVGKKELIVKRFQNTFEHFGMTKVLPDIINAYYFDEMAKQVALIDGAFELLEYLKKKRYQLNIITNGFKDVQHKKLESSGLSPFFEKFFISEEIKVPKPGKEIFEFAIKSSNAKKSKSLMVGDDWDVDILGAVGYGIDAVYLNPSASASLTNVSDKSGSNRNYIFTTNMLLSIKKIL